MRATAAEQLDALSAEVWTVNVNVIVNVNALRGGVDSRLARMRAAGPSSMQVLTTASWVPSPQVWTVALPESDPPSAGASTKPTGQQVAESVVIALAVRNATCGLQFEWSRRSGGHVR